MSFHALMLIVWYVFFTETPNHNSLSASSLFFCTVVSNNYSLIDIEPVINQVDDALATNSIPSPELLKLCFKTLAGASIVLPEELKTLVSRGQHFWCTLNLLFYRMKSEEIVDKLKQLSSRIQTNEQGFLRDAFRVTSDERMAEYLVQATEYYSAVQFYPNSNRMMKLLEWKVYKLPSSSFNIANDNMSQLTFVAQYNLERSQSEDGTPTHMFGRTDIENDGHVSIVNYGEEPGPNVDGYYQMKLLVIEDLKSLKGLPVIARTIRNQETGIHTAIIYGHNRRLQDSLGLEVSSDILYDDDVVMTFDIKTGQHICQCGSMRNRSVELISSECYEYCNRDFKNLFEKNAE